MISIKLDNQVPWEDLHAMLGYIPNWLAHPSFSKLPAQQAIDVNYQHGGGWHSFEGFILSKSGALRYPGDPLLHPLVKFIRTCNGKEEVIYQYRHGWVAVTDADHSTLDVARID